MTGLIAHNAGGGVQLDQMSFCYHGVDALGSGVTVTP
jgi:hypothetical protein